MARRIDALRLGTLTTRNNIAHWTEVLLASTHHPEADGESFPGRGEGGRTVGEFQGTAGGLPGGEVDDAHGVVEPAGGYGQRHAVVAGCPDDDGRTFWRVPCRDPAEELSVCQIPEKKVGCTAIGGDRYRRTLESSGGNAVDAAPVIDGRPDRLNAGVWLSSVMTSGAFLTAARGQI